MNSDETKKLLGKFVGKPGTGFVGPDGEPLTVHEWAALLEDYDRRTLFDTTIEGTTKRVVTMYIGHPKNPFQAEERFGSALFNPPEVFIEELATYPSKELAQLGHWEQVAELTGKG